MRKLSPDTSKPKEHRFDVFGDLRRLISHVSFFMFFLRICARSDSFYFGGLGSLHDGPPCVALTVFWCETQGNGQNLVFLAIRNLAPNFAYLQVQVKQIFGFSISICFAQ